MEYDLVRYSIRNISSDGKYGNEYLNMAWLLKEHIPLFRYKTGKQLRNMPSTLVGYTYHKGETDQKTDLFLAKQNGPSVKSYVCLFDSTIFPLNRDGSSWVEPVLS